VFCQSVCTRGKQDAPIMIRELHSFATRHEKFPKLLTSKTLRGEGSKVAVIGGGPAGLGGGFELAKLGHHVDVFEKGILGGVPRKTIPSFRLPSADLDLDISLISKFVHHKKSNVDRLLFHRLLKSYDAVFISVGLGEDRSLGIPGDGLHGVVPVLQFLENAKAKPKKVRIGKNVVVIGGGNVSLDAAATAKRLGAEHVLLVYRRSEKEMRVWKGELDEARRQGVELKFLAIPVKITGKTRVTGVQCRQTRLGKRKDATGRPIPTEIKGSDDVIAADTVVVAIGQSIGSDWIDELDRTPKGYLKVDDNFASSVPGVFGAGDVIAGEGTIVQSVAQGKQAAQAIHQYLSAR
jgi:dihydropyrimidine dehydrogenase (NAD+) subunit PreT